MRKIISKIAGLMLGLSLAAGVGVSFVNHKSDEAKATDVTDTLTAANFAATNTTYTDFSGVSETSSAVYAGNSAKSSAGGIQLRSKNSNSGIVSTTSGGTVKSVTITVASGSNTIDVYGSNTAYTSASQLYSTPVGTKVGSTAATGTISFTDSYSYVGIRSNNGAVYLTSVEIVWDDGQGGGTEKTVTGLSISGSMTKTAYTTAESWSPAGLTVTATYNNDSSDTEDVTSKVTSWSYNPASPTVSTTSVIATASYGGKTASSSSQTVSVTSAPGTADLPYTVTQALAASAANGVYVTGYISQIDEVSTSHGNATYWISDDGTTTSQMKIYRGKYLNNASFTSSDQIGLGDLVVITGNLSVYSNVNQMAQGNYITSITHPDTFKVTYNANGATGTVPTDSTSYTAQNNQVTVLGSGNLAISGYTFGGWSDGTTTYQPNGTFTISGNVTLTAVWNRNAGTVGGQDNPYDVAGARTAISANVGPTLTSVYVTGVVSGITESWSSQHNNISFNISSDGETTSDQLLVWRCVSSTEHPISGDSDIETGATVTIFGNLKYYNSTYEFDSGCKIVEYTAPAAPELVSLTISGSLSKTTYTTAESWSVAGLTVTATYDNSDTTDVTSSVSWSFYNSSDVEKASPSAFGAGENQTLKIKATLGEISEIKSVTVTVEYVDFVGYSKVTNISGLIIGDSYVIGVENTNHDTDLMGDAKDQTSTAFRNKVDASDAFNAERTLVTQAEAQTAGAVVVTLLSDGAGKYAFYDITNDKYLAGTASGGYFINKTSLADAGDNAWWTIEFADGLMSVTLNNSTRVLGYNAGAPRFATYASYAANSTTASNGTVHPVLFRMDGSSVKTSVTSFANTSLKMNDSAYEGNIETENCQANYEAMKEAYIVLSDAEKNIFQFASDYSDARARLVKWATANHEVFVYGSETPFAAGSNAFISIQNNASTSSTIVIVVVALTSISSIGVLLVIKRKRSLVK